MNDKNFFSYCGLFIDLVTKRIVLVGTIELRATTTRYLDVAT